MKKCSVHGCERVYKCKGLCHAHYQSVLRRGKEGNPPTPRELSSFWNKVFKTDYCWEWTAGLGRGGYGIACVNAGPRKAHRFSWEMHNGQIPDGMDVLHRCDNPKCVRPDHLFLGTDTDNMRDRDSKGRQCQGDRHRSAKVTSQQVKELRRRYTPRSKTDGMRVLMRETGLKASAMKALLYGKTWKSVK